MRVPLDFYRILGVPHQATADQLQQAHRDRMQQLPRYHYSDEAITARRQLIEAAYVALSDPKQRQDYDANFLTNTYVPDPVTDPWAETPSEFPEAEVSGIDIPDHQLAGALSLLQELGEYELVLKLGYPYLSGGILELKHSRLGSILSEADIVLSVALAYLELGREQWQQNQYEKAAQSLKDGLDLLLREGLFSDIQSEIRTDLYKLRPYRVLELLALPEGQERTQGLWLLKHMLTERGGIDGVGNDQSGLGIDDFLQFIQQLRRHLTIAEQRELFEAEAHRPSAVAIYLAVYTLLVQGFTQCQPALIRRARTMLARLSTHQDVYLEQAACALLLGQTEEANQALELSHEYESVAFIRDYSEGSPDLIPGLCLYTERWLEDEVFPYFRDLSSQKADLNAYFDNQRVQAYLEELASGTLYSSGVQNEDEVEDAIENAVIQPGRGNQSYGQATPTRTVSKTIPTSANVAEENLAFQSSSPLNKQPSPANLDAGRPPISGRSWKLPQTQPTSLGAPSSHLKVNSSPNSTGFRNGSSSQTSDLRSPPPAARPQAKKKARKRFWWPFGRVPHEPPARKPQETPRSQLSSRVQGQPDPTRVYSGQSIPEDGRRTQNNASATSRRPKSRLPSRRQHRARLAVLLVLGLLGVGALAAVAGTLLLRRSQPADLSPGTQEEPLVQIERPPLPIVTSSNQLQSESGSGNVPVAAATPLTRETVRQLVQAWQSAKAEALGPKHAVEPLEQVLAEPALSQWRARSEAGKAKDQYWQYKLNRLSVDGLELIGSNQAKAKVTIGETANLFNQGRPQRGASYADNTYQVQYEIVRQRGRWLIRAMGVL